MTLAYHFTGDTLRDGRPIPPIGETLVHDGPLELGASGLHGSLHAFDAMLCAPGPILHRTRHGGEIIHGDDKLVSTERTILATIDATDLLRTFARQCALDVIHLWDAPDAVREYLTTGDEGLRDEARDEARDAATAAWAAAWAATWAAAGNAAAARNAAWAAACDAAQTTQRARFAQMVNEAFGDAA